jgi:hypothetical protein
MALNPTAKDLAAFQKTEVRKFKISSAQVITGTTPITNIIPAVPRMIIWPVRAYLTHAAGTAYVGTPRLNFRWTGLATPVLLSGDMNGFHTLATASHLMILPGDAAAVYRSVVLGLSGTAAVAKPVEAVFSAASTTGNFVIYGLIEYRKLPSSLIQS